jgi:hypothetical protein
MGLPAIAGGNVAPFPGRIITRPINWKGGAMQEQSVNTAAQPEPTYLNRVSAAAYLSKKFGFPCSAQSLAKLAVKGRGPKFKRASGRFAIYPVPALDEWAIGRISSA